MISSFFKNMLRLKPCKHRYAIASVLLITLCSCSSSDKCDELLFLENVMIREGGLFVLMGSKPMSSFAIEDSGFPETDEEIQRAYAQLQAETLASKQHDKPLSYEKFAKKCKTLTKDHHKRLWHSVKDKLPSYVGPKYRFVVHRNVFGRQRKAGLFVNIPNTLVALRRYYPEFARGYGSAFDPELVIKEIDNINSPFWNAVHKSNYTQGLLFGYGRRNSLEFDWHMKHHLEIPTLAIKEQNPEVLFKNNVSVKDLSLPPISVYSFSDRKIEKYRREKDLILKEFHGKDFESTVKEWLSKGKI